MTTREPSAFSYEFATESELKAVEVPKVKEMESVYTITKRLQGN
jgi:hypothetical protein